MLIGSMSVVLQRAIVRSGALVGAHALVGDFQNLAKVFGGGHIVLAWCDGIWIDGHFVSLRVDEYS